MGNVGKCWLFIGFADSYLDADVEMWILAKGREGWRPRCADEVRTKTGRSPDGGGHVGLLFGAFRV